MARAAGDRAAEAQILWSLLLIHRFAGRPSRRGGLRGGGRRPSPGSSGCASSWLSPCTTWPAPMGSWENATRPGRGRRGTRTVEGAGQSADARQQARGRGPTVPLRRRSRARRRATARSRPHRDVDRQPVGRVVWADDRGLGLPRAGRRPAGIDALQEAVEAGRQANNAYAITGIRAELGWALASLGRLEEALASPARAWRRPSAASIPPACGRRRSW